jgi:hypothetical protein
VVTINSLSGGKTSSYIAAKYPADIDIFSLVRIEDERCAFTDKKLRQMVEDRIQKPFIGTIEQDDIIHTIFDLEQYTGREITWVSGPTFDSLIETKKMYLPSVVQRYCTQELKVKPIKQWCYDNTEMPVEMRIGFRANETTRANNMIERHRDDGFEYEKFIVGKKNDRNVWAELPYRICKFPLIEDNIFKDNIEQYWIGKPVRFAYMNNCVGCFHRGEMLLKHMSIKEPTKFDWFVNKEKETGKRFKKETSYQRIKGYKMQFDLFDDDFNECDSGYCGL